MGMLKKFLHDDSGQTTTEYILILAVIVTIIMQFKNKLGTMLTNIFTGVNQQAESLENSN